MDRFAVISDIHGNLHALEAVLGEVDRLGHTEVVCLGDIVGYGPFPHKCVDLTIRCCSIIVRGNHEEAVINADREMEFNGPAREAIMWTRGVLGPLHLDALGRLAETAHPNDSVLCIHDSPAAGSMDYVHDAYAASEAFPAFAEPICLVGHTHVPVVFEALRLGDQDAGPMAPAEIVVHQAEPGVPVPLCPDRRYICNPGSVGQPRDADPRASFAVLDMNDRTFTVHRTAYDIDAAQLATRQAGLPTVLADRLAIGA